MTTTAPFGTWKSPISSELIVSQTIGLASPVISGADVYWLESRPAEGGRNVIVRLRDGQTSDLNPAPSNARTRVHEYGGGAVLVDEMAVYFTDFKDQQIYHLVNGKPVALTDNPGRRYADYVADRRRGVLIAVSEDHRDADPAAGRQCSNRIVSLPLARADAAQPEGEHVLVSGNDFYSNPRLSGDGHWLCWLTWNHPNMPWDGCELWVAEVDADGELAAHRRIAGGPAESTFQPQWSADGTLYFVAEYTGWWNLYRWRPGLAEPEPLTALEAEFGVPMWSFGQSTYSFISPELIVCTYSRHGQSTLALLNTVTRQLQEINTRYTAIGNIHAVDGRAVFAAASPERAAVIASYDLRNGSIVEIRQSSDLDLGAFEGCLSKPQAIEFATGNGQTAHAFYYPPTNKMFRGPDHELPPVLVKSHGGPTGATGSSLRLGYQYWTSRGIGILDVNYRGSTGYGRAYRQQLNGQWGLVDVEDCVNAARHLVAQGVIDGARLMISGGSAGGYTTLCALTFHSVFKAGSSYYGVSDVTALARDTHKFESRYLDSLIGPFPQRQDLYEARSPVNFADRIAAPVLFLQGLEDQVVPPSQSQAMFEALRRNGIRTAYLTFEGEQHGFRKAENIKRALEAEFWFYGKVFGFTPADAIDPVVVENS